MKVRRVLLIAPILSCFFFLLLSAEKAPNTKDNLKKYLPTENELLDWKKDDLPQEYEGEDLFLYINGGADIYHEYGFRQVVIQDYLNKNGKSVSLEIFEMTASDSAFGMFSFKISSSGKQISLGNGGQMADYYLNFWKGNLLVTLTGFDEDEKTKEGLVRIAKAVDTKISTNGKIPALISFLPENGLMETGQKYFKGNIGLFNSYRFFTQNVFRLKEGVKGDYKDGYSLFIFNYTDKEECLERFEEARETFKKSQNYKDYKDIQENLIQITDNKGKTIFISPFDKYLLIVLGSVTQSEATRIIEAVNKNLYDLSHSNFFK